MKLPPLPMSWLTREEALERWPKPSFVDTVYNFPRLFHWVDDGITYNSHSHSDYKFTRKIKVNPRQAKQKAAKMARKINRRK